MTSGRKILTREEALGQEATSSVLRGGTVPDKVEALNCTIVERTRVPCTVVCD